MFYTLRYRPIAQRLFHTVSRNCAATKFGMPAMSPTMEKGGIVAWKVKEGESFKSGDVLLEVETDKAEIDVEAQDDGIMAKILVPEGAKDIDVGKTIAYLAEPEDDIKTLEFPSEEPEKPAPKAAEPKPAAKSEPKPAEPAQSAKPAPVSGDSILTKANPTQTLFPSVASLLAANNISTKDALANIRASGPNGRLLKGDVLVYLGKIPQSATENLASLLKSTEKLDLSNVVAIPLVKEAPAEDSKAKSAEKAEKVPEPPKVLKQNFSLESIIALRNESLGKVKPFTLDEFVSEAITKSRAYALQRHPVKSDYYDDLFEDIVSIPSNVDRFSVKYTVHTPKSAKPSEVLDIFDILADKKPSEPSAPTTASVDVEVTVGKLADSEEKAALFLKKFGEFLS